MLSSPLLPNASRWLAAWACAALTLGAPALAQVTAPPQPALPVANYTSFSDAELARFLSHTLKPEIQQAVRARGLVVVASTYRFNFDNGQACFARLGLAEAPPQGRQPRLPDYLQYSYATGAGPDCDAERLRSAVTALNDESVSTLLQGIERTRHQAPARDAEPPQALVTSLHRRWSVEYDDRPLFALMTRFRLGEAFDHRHVATVINSGSIRFSDGKLMCVAEAGFAARAPQERNDRIPASRNVHAVLRDSGERADCEQAAALGALEKLMKDAWAGPNGRLQGFERVREDGVPLPDRQRVAAVEKQLAAAPAAAPAAMVRTQQLNRTSCSNQCVNGDCLRTLADGTQERWQAPRLYDAIQRDWVWDTNSCGG